MKTIKNKIILSLFFALFISFSTAILLFNPLNVQAESFSPSGNICVESAAMVRVMEEKESGLRWQSYVKKSWYDEELSDDKQAGAIIVPQSYVLGATENGSLILTLNGLLTYVKNNDLPFSAVDTAGLASYNLDYYTFALTITKILDANYARDFVCIAYVRASSGITNPEEISGGSEYNLDDGNYTIFYDQACVRSVYDVAYKALTLGNPSENAKPILESYVDGVAVLEKVDDTVKIANNVEGKYRSPYSVYGSDGKFFVVSATTNAKSYIYNETRQTAFPIVKDGITIHATKTNGVKAIDDSGNITLKGVTPANVSSGSLKSNLNNSYIAFDAEYESGTYLEFEFKGNNMPQLCFYANNINGNMSFGPSGVGDITEDGLLVLNGLVTTDGVSNWTNAVKAFGAHRYGYGGDDSSKSTFLFNKTDTSLSQSELSADKEYRLVIGTYIKPTTDGKSTRVRVEMILFDKTTNKLIKSFDETTGKAVEFFTGNASKNPSGKIIAFAALKGGEDTSFKFVKLGAKTDFVTV